MCPKEETSAALIYVWNYILASKQVKQNNKNTH